MIRLVVVLLLSLLEIIIIMADCKDIVVRSLYDNNNNVTYEKNECILEFNLKVFRCTLGKNGVIDSSLKVEGDGCTPKGSYNLRECYYRSDKIPQPITKLQIFQINENDGWVDDPNDYNYNKHVILPYNTSHECLYRSDNLYNLFAVIGYNDDPVIPFKGSAIFFHIANDYHQGTAGCVALSFNDLQYVLANIDQDSKIIIY